MRASHSVKNASSPEHDWNRGIHFDTGSKLGSKLEIDAIAPKGSIYNPNFPAAAEARFSHCGEAALLTRLTHPRKKRQVSMHQGFFSRCPRGVGGA